MAKLTMLKPKLATLPSRIKTIAGNADSWRTGKQGSTARGYGYRWQKARARFLSEHPLCCYREIVPVLTDKGHYEQRYEVYGLTAEQIAENVECGRM